MEMLSKHIEFLLLRHDCIIVPGIGAFINIYTPPSYDPESERIMPPCKEVVFNSSLKSDDGLLASSYARKRNISYREGSELLSGDVKMLNELLDIEKEATIGRIGIIRKEEEGNIRFIPFKSPETCATLVGLESVPMSRLDSGSRAIPNDNQTLFTPNEELQVNIHSTNQSSEEKPLNKKSERVFNTEKNYYIPVNKFFSKICAATLIICFLTLICLNLPHKANPNEEQASVLPVEKVIDSAVHHFSSSIHESEDINKESSVVLQEEMTMKEDMNIPQYFLIVATCTTREEAERFITKKDKTGYDLKILPSSKYFRVSAYNDSDRNRTISIMQSPEFKASFAESWIMKE